MLVAVATMMASCGLLFLQAEDGIRDLTVTGVQTCALPISSFHGKSAESTWIYRVAFNTSLAWKRGEKRRGAKHEKFLELNVAPEMSPEQPGQTQIGRASCRERG